MSTPTRADSLTETETDTDTDVPQVPVTDELVLDLLDDAREVAGVLAAAYPEVPEQLRSRP